ncbi:methionyl-tRNA formyltransferase [Dissulfurimicrobium hydrothermale]|uniref:methionyl-tRNA formyltransferase n=1 Tax=Dissulfurimicrobium hydrothermale TaxID=1750598 RepID=UPI001EDBC6BB|nr:methionyl-tRNA formyltransferase [Dissulfurimicrobium hydrothermale]UKL14404.1 methionyl-tRNA formyltransferase [Dissulfurimicrobium hydrothermale]
MDRDKIFRIVFMGTPDFALPSLRALLDSKDEVTAVVTQPDRPRGRGKRPLPSPVKEEALLSEIPVIQPEKADDPRFIKALRDLSPDLLVTAAFGQILPKQVLDIPSIMSINVHGSLLPKFRGAAPIQWAILKGEKETGVTIMQMDIGMDTGPILLAEAVTIEEDETYGRLYRRLAELGARLLLKAIRGLKEGAITPFPQPKSEISYAPPLGSGIAWIDWAKPAEELHCLIRALDPRPGAYTIFRGKRLKLFSPIIIKRHTTVTPGTVLESGENGLLIATGRDSLLVQELFLAGKRRLGAKEFLKGTKITDGIVLGS